MRNTALATICILLWPLGAAAQTDQTLADIRQELTVFNVEIQRLKRELSTTGSGQAQLGAGSLLDRVNAIESELQRLTGKTEELEFRIGRVVADGTNRIGDLEFRLVELEGGDIGSLGETSTLGGETQVTAPAVIPSPTSDNQLATQEAADFERASEALAQGDFRSAADQFASFNQAYPGGPLSVEADLRRGDALDGLSDTRSAARAYLDAFSADQTGPLAAESLYKVGAALGRLGQTVEACATLAEVPARFPNTESAGQAVTQLRNIGCS